MAVRVCVFCRRHPAQPAWQPFCSERCKLQDLAKWVDGEYRIAAEPLSPESDDHDEDDIENEPTDGTGNRS